MINIIVACDRNNLIGKNGKLPWNINEDWEYFLDKTKDGALIMGRHCYLDFEEQAKTRTVIALSRDPEYNFPNAIKAGSLKEALEKANLMGKTAWICGGKEIYAEALPLADRIYLTEIDKEYAGDVYLPKWESYFPNQLSSKTVYTNSANLTFRVLSK